MHAIQFGLLGPVDAYVGGRSVALGGTRTQAVLAALLLEANRVVPIDRVVEAAWGDDPPDGTRVQAQNRVSTLRRLLRDAGGGDVIETRGTGYLIRVEAGHLDVATFNALVSRATEDTATGDLDRAAAALVQALSVWRGPALDGLGTPRLASAARHLDESRVAAQEQLIDIELRRGNHDRVIGELVELVAAYPWRERPVGQLMTALYRANRMQEALACFDQLRQRLAEELGIDPGRDLVRLRDLILRNAAELELPEPGGAKPGTAGPRPAAGAAAAAATATAGASGSTVSLLPRAIPDFVGRTGELATLDGMATIAANGRSASIVAITGAGGVGKTALAAYWAHAVTGDFPGGQLFVNLRGYGPGRPVRPIEALASFLRALGVPVDQIPVDEVTAVGMLRTLLAGKRMLVFLDNAASADQVRPLLPANAGSLVLVTSRDRLTGLSARDGARRLPLRSLGTDEAVELLGQMIGTERLAAERSEATELAAACGHLPLALRIAGAQLEDDPDRTIADYLGTLRLPGRLSTLAITGDDQSAVRLAFDESYGSLPEVAAELFCLLSLVPGPTFTAETGAALLDTSRSEAATLLERLAVVYLIERTAPDRYAFHDLLRDYAGERAGAEPVRAGAEVAARLYRHYVERSDAASRARFPGSLRLPGPQPATGAGFDNPAAALAWLDAERANLIAAAVKCAADGPAEVAWLLVDALRQYFWIRPDSVEAPAVAASALAAATAAANPEAMAAMEYAVGMSHLWANRYREALEHLNLAINRSRQAGWPDCEAAALGSLGIAHSEFGQLRDAVDQYRQAMALNERIGRTAGLGNNFGNLGLLELRMGEFRSAVEHLDRAVALHREVGNRNSLALHMRGLGKANGYLGSYPAAFDLLSEALAICRELGNTDNEARILVDLALLRGELGDCARALADARAAMALSEHTHEPDVTIPARHALAAAHRCLGEHAKALAEAERAAELATGEVQFLQLSALVVLADAELHAGATDRAYADAHKAAAMAAAGGFRHLQGLALETLAELALGEKAPERAAELAGQALEIHHGSAYRLGQGRALALLGRATPAPADRGHLAAALAIFTELGVPDAGSAGAVDDEVGVLRVPGDVVLGERA